MSFFKKFLGGGGGRKGFGGFFISTFSGLNDVPHSYAGKANYVVTVNGAATGLTFVLGRGVADGFASLDGTGKLPTSQLPALAISEFLGIVANQAAMILLTGQVGDWCIRSDTSTTWIITANDGHLITDWTEIAYPAQPYKVLADATDPTAGYLDAKVDGKTILEDATAHKIGVNKLIGVLPIITIFDNTAALPVGPGVGDRYIALVTALGWTIDNIYEWNGTAWVETVKADSMFVFNNFQGTFYMYGGGVWSNFLALAPGDHLVKADATDPAPDFLDQKVDNSTIEVTAAHVLKVKNLVRHLFYADQLLTPNNADWTVNAASGMSADSLNNALLNRQFDDTTEEGIGFFLEIPAGAVNMTFYFRSRAQTAPGAATTVLPRLYRRQVIDNTVIGAWSAAFAFAAIGIPTNTRFQYDSETVTLATLGLAAGNVVQFELTRDPADGLVGDWNLLELCICFN